MEKEEERVLGNSEDRERFEQFSPRFGICKDLIFCRLIPMSHY